MVKSCRVLFTHAVKWLLLFVQVCNIGMLRNYRAQLREVKEGTKGTGDSSRAGAENVDPGGTTRPGSSGNTRDGRPGKPCVWFVWVRRYRGRVRPGRLCLWLVGVRRGGGRVCTG